MMSFAIQPRPLSFKAKKSITIIASRFNEEMTNALVENCVAELKEIAPNVKMNIVRVPGAYEIPVLAKIVASSEKKADVIIALGLILRGGTEHGDLIAQSVTYALQEIAVETKTPIINQVLLVDDETQAYARCVAQRINRGREGARAAVSMLDILSELQSHYL